MFVIIPVAAEQRKHSSSLPINTRDVWLHYSFSFHSKPTIDMLLLAITVVFYGIKRKNAL